MKSTTAPFVSCIALLRHAAYGVFLAFGADGMAQGFVQQFPITDSPYAYGDVVLTPDGGLIVRYDMSPISPFIRYEPDGSVLWTRGYSVDTGIDARGHTIMPDGGLVLSGSVDWYFNGAGRYSHVRIGPNGEVLWARRHVLSDWPVPVSWTQLSGSVLMDSDEEGGVFALLPHLPEAVNGPSMLKCDANGLLQWAIDLKETNPSGNARVIADEQGGCYVPIVRYGGPNGGSFVLHRLEADGALAWRRVFQSIDQGPAISAGFHLDGNGDLLVAGWMGAGAYTLRIASNGALIDSKFFDSPWAGGFPPEFALSTLATPEGHIRFGERHAITLNATGEMVRNQLCPEIETILGDEQHRFNSYVAGSDEHGVALRGYTSILNNSTFNLQTGFLAARIPWHAIGNGCLSNCEDLPVAEPQPLSNETFLYFEEPYDGPFPLTSQNHVLNVLVTDVELPTTTRLCPTLGIPSSLDAATIAHAWPNPVTDGEPLQLNVMNPIAWRCTDATGRAIPIAPQRSVQGLLLPTTGLSSGLYTLHVQVAGSATPVVARFVVQ